MKPASQLINTDFKLGVLGGGQLGKMMGIAAANWHLPFFALDQSGHFPAGLVTTGFTEGNFQDYQDVLDFGADKDLLTIEIEHINTKALRVLESKGKIVHPRPDALDIIKDKGRQKLFYREHDLPTAPFSLYENKEELLADVRSGALTVPFVQKTRTAGYDGKGVFVVRTEADLPDLLEGACLAEAPAPIDKELAVIVARNPSGQVAAYPAVEMLFHPTANLVEFLLCPAQIPAEVAEKAEMLARRTIAELDICGLLAVELFLNRDGSLWINEVAPRPHNSGHHTIDSSYTSQFEQHLRGILDLPLGSTRMKAPVGIMVNLLGAAGHHGKARYEGLEEILAREGVYVHLYGKADTKPFRKMGHATILADDLEEGLAKARMVESRFRITAQ